MKTSVANSPDERKCPFHRINGVFPEIRGIINKVLWKPSIKHDLEWRPEAYSALLSRALDTINHPDFQRAHISSNIHDTKGINTGSRHFWMFSLSRYPFIMTTLWVAIAKLILADEMHRKSIESIHSDLVIARDTTHSIWLAAIRSYDKIFVAMLEQSSTREEFDSYKAAWLKVAQTIATMPDGINSLLTGYDFRASDWAKPSFEPSVIVQQAESELIKLRNKWYDQYGHCPALGWVFEQYFSRLADLYARIYLPQ